MTAFALLALLGLGSCASEAEALQGVHYDQLAEGTRAWVELEAAGLVLWLEDLRGGVTATRRLDSAGDCRELSEAVALVVDAWTLSLRLRRQRPSPPGPAPSPDAGLVDVTPAPPSGPSAIVGAAARERDGLAVSVAAQLRVQLPIQTAAVAARVDWRRLRGGVELGGGMEFTVPTQTQLGPGRVTWWRGGVSTELRVRQAVGPYDLHAGVGGALSILLLTGAGFTTNSTSWALDPRLELTVGAAVALRPRLYVEARLSAGWHPFVVRAAVAGVEGTVMPGHFELAAGLGAGWLL